MDNRDMELELKIKEDWHNLKKIKTKNITEQLCDIAFNNNYEAIKLIPNRYKKKYSKDAMKYNWRLYNYCNPKSLSISDWYGIIKNINYSDLKSKDKTIFEKISIYLADKYKDNKIKKYLEKQFGSKIIRKAYENNIFIVEKKLSVICSTIEYTFQSFDEFYLFLNGDLSDSDIYEFDFQGVDLKRYDLHNVAINSSILIENGLYDDTYYNKTIVPLINHNNVLIKNNDCDNITILHENDILPYQSGDFIKRASIYYISDIHLDEKLVKKFRNHATKYEIEQYIENIVDKMVNSIAFEFVSKYILIAGDVSASFEISKIFYKKLVENGRINPSHIICVLGNHELWNVGRPLNSKVDDIIELYRKMFNKLNITFLQNDLLIDNSEIEVISEAKLISMSDEELKQKTISSHITIFGGIGFSGFNPGFNASNSIYLETIKTIQEDKQLTNNFYHLYSKLKKVLYSRRLIILTHNPKHDWSLDSFNPNWIYINGHTHKNVYEKGKGIQLYADNQIGYYGENIRLKRIDYSLKCNIFGDFEDGIYNISLDQYLLFYRKMGYSISCKLPGEFYLLKNDDVYMFIYKNNKDNLYILNGGKYNRLEKNDIKYYYNHMSQYSNIIKKGTKSFYDYMNNLSEYIKSIGGSGHIHGAIIDIDFYNHIYLNIYDGKITPYWAASMDYKVIYSSVQELLTKNCPKMLENIKNSKDNNLIKMKNELIPKGGQFYEDTGIYKESRIMKRIQYLVDDNIIRIWNDNLLDEKEIKLLINE